MQTTRLSLLESMASGANREIAWQRFCLIYSPLLFRWLNAWKVPASLQEDIAQDALVRIIRGITTYDQKRGQFRTWLVAILKHTWIDWKRKKALPTVDFDAEMIPSQPSAAEFDEQEYRHYVLARLNELVVARFPPVSQAAFRMTVLENQPIASVAAQLNLTANAVYLIRSRILTRIREELNELLD